MDISLGVGINSLRKVSGEYPDGPGSGSGTMEVGVNDGEVDFSISALPGDWGEDWAGGAADNGKLQGWDASRGSWINLAVPAATGDYTIELLPSVWGTEVIVRFRFVNDAGVPGTITSDTLEIAGAQHEEKYLVMPNDDQIVLDTGELVTVFVEIA